uniref:Phosphofructokinase domain-containing protein n=2 Tax=Caenorhabditis japonica TaxID=281687 RepID=A0A8R1HI68_CAEJA
MEQKSKKAKNHGVGVLTSGGDSQGMNSAVRAVVRETLRQGHRCYLIREGFTGLITGKIELATWAHVARTAHIGGSIIGTSRCDEFRTSDGRKKAGKNLFAKRIFHLIVIEELFAAGVITEEVANEGRELRLAGIVGSIDNDCIESDKSIGSDTALHRICEAIDGLVMTAQSHQRVFVVEVMGRHCGYLALTAAIAVEADYVFYPEMPPDDNWPEQLCHQLDSVRKFGKRQNVIILGEGVVNSKGVKIDGKKVKEEVETRLQLEVRIATLGHLQRGGAPTFLDRLLGLRMGYEAVQEILRTEDEDGSPLIGAKNVAKVMCLRGHNIERNDMSRVIRQIETANEETCNGSSDLACKLRGFGFLDKQTYLNFVSVPLTTEMPERSKVFAIIHIGSPCAGMNAATFSFTRMANHSGLQVLGIKNGWDGLKNNELTLLTWENVQGWAQAGGSYLGAKRQLPSELDKIADGLNANNIDGLVIVGGFLAFQSALIFQQTRIDYSCFNIPIVVIPATISNNCPGTCMSLGADTALNEICRQVDNIRQNAMGCKNKVMIIETMGSRSGFLSTMTALSTGSEFALIRQIEHAEEDLKKLAIDTKKRLDSGNLEKYLLVRSEGASDSINSSQVKYIFDKVMENQYGVRITNLGYSQLGGHPSCFDRQMGIRMGVRAFEGVVNPLKMGRRDCCVIGLRGSSLRYVPVQGLEKKVCFDHGIPLNMWWLELHPLVEAMTKKPDQVIASEAAMKQSSQKKVAKK